MSAHKLLLCIKLPSVFNTFVFPFFDWLTGLTVGHHISYATIKINTVKPALSGHTKTRPKIGFQD